MQEPQGEQLIEGKVVILSKTCIQVDIGTGATVEVAAENVMSRETNEPVDRSVYRTLNTKMVQLDIQGQKAWTD